MKPFTRAIGMLLNPRREWQKIKGEPLTVTGIFTGYAMVLAAIPALAGFIGYSLVGVSLPFFGTFRYPLVRGLAWAALTYVLSLAGALLLTLVVDKLAPAFGGRRDMPASAKTVVFAHTAAWVGGVFNALPALALLAVLAGLYSLVLLWLGMRSLQRVPAGKTAGYFAVTLAVAVAVFLLAGWIASLVVLSGGVDTGIFGSQIP
jgi:hypothetical protein